MFGFRSGAAKNEGSSKKSGSIKSKVQRRSQRGGDSAAGSVLSRGSAAISSVFSTGSASSSIFRGSQGSADDGDESHAGAQGSRVVRGSRGAAGSSKVQRRSKVLRGGGTQGRTTFESSMMEYRSPTLGKQLTEAVNDESLSDVVFLVGPERKIVRGLRIVGAAPDCSAAGGRDRLSGPGAHAQMYGA